MPRNPDAVLTVAIPTYNRDEQLRQTVAALLPQLTTECRLLVLDNCSPTPVVGLIADLLAGHPEVDITVERNRFNIGANANICRCFEHSETEWLWVLGDDDPPLPHGVATVLTTIRKHPEAVYVNFASDFHPRVQGKTTRGRREFLLGMDNLSNANAISVCVFRAAVMRPYLSYGLQYAYSCMPHLVMVVMAAGEDGLCVFGIDKVVKTPQTFEWMMSYVMLGQMTFAELPIDTAMRKALFRLIPTSFGALGRAASEFVLNALENGDDGTNLYLFDSIARRLHYYDRSLKSRLAIGLYRFMIRHPRFGAWLAYRRLRWRYGKEFADRETKRRSRLFANRLHRLF